MIGMHVPINSYNDKRRHTHNNNYIYTYTHPDTPIHHMQVYKSIMNPVYYQCDPNIGINLSLIMTVSKFTSKKKLTWDDDLRACTR